MCVFGVIFFLYLKFLHSFRLLNLKHYIRLEMFVLFGLASVFVGSKMFKFIRFTLAHTKCSPTIYSANKLCRARCFTTLVLFISFISIIIALFLFVFFSSAGLLASRCVYSLHSILHIRFSCSSYINRAVFVTNYNGGFIPIDLFPLCPAHCLRFFLLFIYIYLTVCSFLSFLVSVFFLFFFYFVVAALNSRSTQTPSDLCMFELWLGLSCGGLHCHHNCTILDSLT